MEHEEFKRQHLEFVQNVITRMASNSFQIKGFTMVMATLLAGLWGRARIYFSCTLSSLRR